MIHQEPTLGIDGIGLQRQKQPNVQQMKTTPQSQRVFLKKSFCEQTEVGESMWPHRGLSLIGAY